MPLNRELKTNFNSITQLYEEVRPQYPEELFAELISFPGLQAEAKILDIGCGSGQATIPMAQKGYSVVGLDISENFLNLLKEKTKNLSQVTFIQDSFENAKLEPESFDLIMAAQSFHWVDPAIGYPKVVKLLKPNGTFALFWNILEHSKTTWLSAIAEAFKKYCPDYTYTQPEVFVTKQKADLFERGGYQSVEDKHYFREIPYSKDKFKLLLTTFSWVNSLPLEQKNKFLAEVDILISDLPEKLLIPYRTDLFLGRK